jgi:ABC-2 type transport system ATP-binding protein
MLPEKPGPADAFDSGDAKARAAETAPVVETFDLTRKFASITAIDRASLFVSPREIFGLIGPNGAGKSTLMKMLTTMLPPTSGRALVAGFDIVKEAAQVRRRIGYVPQLLSADGELTGYENMLLSARLYLIPRAEREQRIAAALEMMALTDQRDRLVRTYSGGMIRRLEIAQSTLHRPAVLFMDEPTVGLDPSGRHTVWQHIRHLREEMGAAVIITTHYMDEAAELCDRIAVIHRGRIEAIGTPAELTAKVGPAATLDDAFMLLTGAEIEASGGYRDVRQTRLRAREHS